MQHVETLIEKLEVSSYNENKYIKQVSEKIKVRPEYVTLVLMLLGLLLLLFTPFGHTILKSFFTFLYPAYRSFKAKVSECKEDDKKWLIYWIVYGLLYSFQVIFSNLFEVS